MVRSTIELRRRQGFTLLELLVALALIGILTSLVLCGVQKVRAMAANMQCKARLRNVALAVLNYEADYQHYPIGCAYPRLRSEFDYRRHTSVSWLTAILPYIENTQLWQDSMRLYAVDPEGNSEEHNRIRKVLITTYLCPMETRSIVTNGSGLTWAVSNYLGVAGTSWYYDDGMFHRDLVVHHADVTDGTSNTLLIGERPVGRNDFTGWYSAWGASNCHLAQILEVTDKIHGHNDNTAERLCGNEFGVFYQGVPNTNCDVGHYWSLHPNGANFAFADGSVHFLPYTQAKILQALATRAGGEVIPE